MFHESMAGPLHLLIAHQWCLQVGLRKSKANGNTHRRAREGEREGEEKEKKKLPSVPPVLFWFGPIPTGCLTY